MATIKGRPQRAKPKDAVLTLLEHVGVSGQLPQRADIESAIPDGTEGAERHRDRLMLAARQIVGIRKTRNQQDAVTEARTAAHELIGRLPERPPTSAALPSDPRVLAQMIGRRGDRWGI